MTDQIRTTARTEFDRSGSTLTAYVVGELDPATADAVGEEITAAAEGVKRLVINLAEVTFCDSSGLRLFLVLHETMAEAGGTLTVQDPTPMVRRLLEVCGLAELFPIHGIG